MLSEASRFLIEEWGDVSRLLAAHESLRRELEQHLNSLEREVSKQDWWSDEWEFVPFDEDQVYVARKEWRRGSDHLLWIGVEDFIPERLFGDGEGARTYPWVPSGERGLMTELRNNATEAHQPSGKGKYVCSRRLQTIAQGEDPDKFLDALRAKIVQDWTACAKIARESDRTISALASR